MLRSVVTVGATLGALVVLATCGARGSYAAPARLLYSHACFSFAIPDTNGECRATFAELQSKELEVPAGQRLMQLPRIPAAGSLVLPGKRN